MLFILQDTSVCKIPSFRTGPWDHTGREHSHCRRLQCTCGSAPHWPRRRKASQAQNQLCAPQSDGPLLMCALSPGGLLTASPCFGSSLKPVKCPPSTFRGVRGGVWGLCSCCFPPYFALETKFLSSILVWLGQWKGEGKQKEMAGLLSPFLRGGKPRMMVRDRVLQLHLCQGDFSPPSVLSSAEAELQLEAGAGFLRKEEKLGNVY